MEGSRPGSGSWYHRPLPRSPPCPQHSYSPFPSSASPLTTHFYCIWSFYLSIARTNSNFVLLLLLPGCERFLLLIFFSFSPQIQVQTEWEVDIIRTVELCGTLISVELCGTFISVELPLPTFQQNPGRGRCQHCLHHHRSLGDCYY